VTDTSAVVSFTYITMGRLLLRSWRGREGARMREPLVATASGTSIIVGGWGPATRAYEAIQVW
jgi:hypothetical protein